MTIDELISKIKAGSGSDVEIDSDVCITAKFLPVVGFLKGEKITKTTINTINSQFNQICVEYDSGGVMLFSAPPFTASLDATKRMLDEAEMSFTMHNDGSPTAFVYNNGDKISVSGYHDNDIHRAFLIGALMAIQEKNKS